MGVVGVKEDEDDEKFSYLAVPVKVYEEKEYSCKKGEEETVIAEWLAFRVYTHFLYNTLYGGSISFVFGQKTRNQRTLPFNMVYIRIWRRL